jgi:hypothetical protein
MRARNHGEEKKKNLKKAEQSRPHRSATEFRHHQVMRRACNKPHSTRGERRPEKHRRGEKCLALVQPYFNYDCNWNSLRQQENPRTDQRSTKPYRIGPFQALMSGGKSNGTRTLRAESRNRQPAQIVSASHATVVALDIFGFGLARRVYHCGTFRAVGLSRRMLILSLGSNLPTLIT